MFLRSAINLISILFINLKDLEKNIHDKKYIKFLEKINKFENVSVYDENFSSSSILKNSNLAICSPFTSVGIIAKSLNIKAAYYDLMTYIIKKRLLLKIYRLLRIKL